MQPTGQFGAATAIQDAMNCSLAEVLGRCTIGDRSIQSSSRYTAIWVLQTLPSFSK